MDRRVAALLVELIDSYLNEEGLPNTQPILDDEQRVPVETLDLDELLLIRSQAYEIAAQ